MSIFCDGCTSELNNATISSLNIYTRSIFHAVNSCPSSIQSTSLLHFCAIVALIEAHFGRRHLLMFEFRDFQECEAQNEASSANLCIRRGGAEVGMIAVHHLGGPLGTSCVGLGNAKRWRRLNVGNHYPEVHIRELSLSLCNFHFTTLSLLPEVPTNEIPPRGTTNQPTNQLC